MEPQSLISSEVSNMIMGFADNLVPTVMNLLIIIVPVGLSLWGISFGVRKGLNYLKQNANKSV